MAFSVGAGGSWKNVPAMHVGASGTWKRIVRIWGGSGGSWKEAYQADALALVGGTISDANLDPGTATAEYQVNADGLEKKRTHLTTTTLGTWVTPVGSAQYYEISATLNSGTAPTGTLGSWLALTSDRVWKLEVNSASRSCQLGIEIRRASDQVVVATATVTMNADSV